MKINNIKKKLAKIGTSIGFILITGRPVYAMSPLSIDGMSDVATSFKNLIGYAGLFILAGGTGGLVFGLYQFFQSFRSQDGEAKHKGLIEAGIGIACIALGYSATTFKNYVQIQ